MTVSHEKKIGQPEGSTRRVTVRLTPSAHFSFQALSIFTFSAHNGVYSFCPHHGGENELGLSYFGPSHEKLGHFEGPVQDPRTLGKRVGGHRIFFWVKLSTRPQNSNSVEMNPWPKRFQKSRVELHEPAEISGLKCVVQFP